MNKINRKLYEMHADVCRVFTSPKRLEIMDALRTGEWPVGKLARKLRLSQANLSQHLIILREKGVVDTRRDGTTIYYSLANPKIIKAFDIIRKMLLEKMSDQGKTAKDILNFQKKR
ncbi:MAG: metalloregulator ArsR/SmtB family transcription factor [Planctomycetota bacterium]